MIDISNLTFNSSSITSACIGMEVQNIVYGFKVLYKTLFIRIIVFSIIFFLIEKNSLNLILIWDKYIYPHLKENSPKNGLWMIRTLRIIMILMMVNQAIIGMTLKTVIPIRG